MSTTFTRVLLFINDFNDGFAMSDQPSGSTIM
jgi:hypothetical protein